MSMTLDTKDYIKLMKTMDGLSKLERDAIIAKGLQESIIPIVQKGKSNLSSSSIKVRKGNLSKSLGKKVLKNRMKAYGGFKRPEGAAAHLIDRGTKVRKTLKSYTDKLGRTYPAGINRGKVTGNYFWTRAVEAEGPKAQQILMESVQKSIDRIIRRNNL